MSHRNTTDNSPHLKTWKVTSLCVSIALLVSISPVPAKSTTYATQTNCRLFAETAKTVCNRFLEYWDGNGKLAQQGYPISEEMQEKSDLDGKTYTVQYFERAVFELHPENQPPYDVLLSLLGRFQYKKQWPGPYYPLQQANPDNPLFFQETGKTIGGTFRKYWEANGGLAQQGYPITNEFQERSLLDGNLYTVQYFERGVFEWHPENQPPYNVLLSQLGRSQYKARYMGPKAGPTPITGDPRCMEAQKNKGTVIAQGSNSTPTGSLRLKTYQIDEVRLPGPVTCKYVLPVDTTFDKFWRVTIFADGPFYEGSRLQFMWLDDTQLGTTIGVRDRYTTRVFDLGLLREGGVLCISLGLSQKHCLPEKLHFNRVP